MIEQSLIAKVEWITANVFFDISLLSIAYASVYFLNRNKEKSIQFIEFFCTLAIGLSSSYYIFCHISNGSSYHEIQLRLILFSLAYYTWHLFMVQFVGDKRSLIELHHLSIILASLMALLWDHGNQAASHPYALIASLFLIPSFSAALRAYQALIKRYSTLRIHAKVERHLLLFFQIVPPASIFYFYPIIDVLKGGIEYRFIVFLCTGLVLSFFAIYYVRNQILYVVRESKIFYFMYDFYVFLQVIALILVLSTIGILCRIFDKATGFNTVKILTFLIKKAA